MDDNFAGLKVTVSSRIDKYGEGSSPETDAPFATVRDGQILEGEEAYNYLCKASPEQAAVVAHHYNVGGK